MNIRDRLENWADAAHWGGGGYGGQAIGSLEGRYRPERPKEDEADVTRVIRPEPDFVDAALVDAEWIALTPHYKWMLKFLYINNASVSFICRRLKIKHNPRSIFDMERTRAEQTLSKKLASRAFQGDNKHKFNSGHVRV